MASTLEDFPLESPGVHQYLTVPHRVIVWPQVHAHLINFSPRAASALQGILQRGTPWFIKLEMDKHSSPLPCGPLLPSVQPSTTSVFPSITTQHAQDYTEAYFRTFNACRPILNYDSFLVNVVGHISHEGFADGDPQSVLALMVFALGQVAIEEIFSQHVSAQHGKSSGPRGSRTAKPPGIEMFNEARRRLGFVLDAGTLENVQILLLQATYYETSSRHVDFWRSTVAASMECQILIKCRGADSSTPIGDLNIRAYWACVLNEELYHLDLDLPQSGIHSLQDEVQLPNFFETRMPSQQSADEAQFIQYHFLALITLRRLIVNVNETAHECTSSCYLRFSERLLTTSQPPQPMQKSLMTTEGPRLQ